MKKFGSRSGRFAFYFFTVLAFFLSIGVAVFFIIRYQKYYAGLPSNDDIYQAWEQKDYKTAFEQTAKVLAIRPDSPELLALHGFAAYYVSAAQTSQTDAAAYLDESIVFLRRALYTLNQADLPRLYYILGKAYYQKGYFYYDLALKYLDLVFELGGQFADVNKFRGMALSYLGEDEKAIEAFTYDLDANADEFLLYALAKNYINVGNFEKAKMYLTDASAKAKDVMVKLDCKSQLAQVYEKEGELEKARLEYTSILEINEKYADAYYGLGCIYEKTGDLIRARAEWRKALKVNPLHAGAIEKLKG